MSKEWIVLEYPHDFHPQHPQENETEPMSLEDAVALVDSMGGHPDWKIRHVHGKYEPDSYAVMRIRNPPQEEDNDNVS